MKRLLSLVCAAALLVTGIGPAAVLTAGAADPDGTWEKQVPPVATVWYDEIGETTVPLDEYPNPQLEREDWMNLNGLWSFAGSSSEFAEPASYTQQIMVPYAMETALSGIMKHYDHAWYSREFTVPADWDRDARIVLHFEAVDWKCSVYVNGEEVVKDHTGGYEAFAVDITDALKDGVNTLSVKVFDATDVRNQTVGKQRNGAGGIYYTATSGIWQTVWLEPVSAQAYIEDIKIDTDIDAGTVSLTVNQAGSAAATVDVDIAIGDTPVLSRTGLAVGEAQTLQIPSELLYLWSPDTPHLYDLTLTLKAGGETVDTVQSYFGMRKIEIRPTGRTDSRGDIMGIYLNNEPIFSNGVLDQSYWPESGLTPPTDEAMIWDIQATKDLGFNTSRKHVTVAPKRWYYYCDLMGLMVWQDQPSLGETGGMSYEDYKDEVYGLVTSHWNHPSIVQWIVYNEGWGQHGRVGQSLEDPSYTIDLTNSVKSWDPSRLVCPGSGGLDVEAGDIVDNHNYTDVVPGYSGTRARICGEYGGLNRVLPGHIWTENYWDGYTRGYTTDEAFEAAFYAIQDKARSQKAAGMMGCVYTQITDIEEELNGLWSYDRKVLKADQDALYTSNLDLTTDGVLTKAPLTGVIERMELLDESLYTPESWATAEAARAEAETALQKDRITQLEVYQVSQALSKALDGLLKVGEDDQNKDALQAAIREAATYEEIDYTSDSWAAFESALSQAQRVNSLHSSTGAEIRQATEDLADAMEALQWVPINKTALQAAITRAGTFAEATYTAGSWAKLQAALTAANEADGTETIRQSAVDAATAALNTAIDGLVEKVKDGVNREGLDAALTAVEALDPLDYTAESWNLLEQDYRKHSRTITTATSQEELDEAAEDLWRGIEDLVLRGADKTALKDSLRYVQGLTESDYLPDSWQALETALAQAKLVNKDADAEQEAVDEATAALDSAIDALRVAEADRTALGDAIEAAGKLQESSYSEPSWARLQSALQSAMTVVADAGARQSALDKAAAAIHSAIADLCAPGGVEKAYLAATIEKAEGLWEFDYTYETWGKMVSALESARKAKDKAGVTQSEIDAANRSLDAAVTALKKREEGVLDQGGLEAAIARAEKLNQSDYTAEAWAAIQAALTAAKDLYYIEPTGDEFLKNGSFESGLNDWKVDDLANCNPKINVDASAAVDGNNRLDCSSHPYKYEISQTLTGLQDGTYIFSMYLRGRVENKKISYMSATSGDGVAQVEWFHEQAWNEPWTYYEYEVEVTGGTCTVLVHIEGTTQDKPGLDVISFKNKVDKGTPPTQEDVDDAVSALDAAMAGEAGVVKTALQNAIQSAQALNEADYEPDSWADLQAALQEALRVNGDPDATQQQVDAQTTALKAAIGALQPVGGGADKAALNEEIALAQALKQGEYTAASWEPLAQALATARALSGSPTATQSQVDAAVKALREAREALVKRPVVDPGDALYATGFESNGEIAADSGVHSVDGVDIAFGWGGSLVNAGALAHSGDYAVKFADWGRIEVDLSLEPGKTYVVTGYYQNTNANGGPLRVQLKPDGATADDDTVAGGEELQIAGGMQDYEKFTVTIAVPEDFAGGYLLLKWQNESGAGVYIDDLAVAEEDEEPAVEPGDVNGDGVVNSSDARLVLQFTVELITLTPAQQEVADLSGDGAVNSSDARLILQKTVSLPTA